MKKKTKKELDWARLFYILGAVVFATAVGLLIFYLYPVLVPHKSVAELQTNGGGLSKTVECPFRRALDGVCVGSESAVRPRLVGVMVENHFDSWPQAGLGEASIVYEAPVEAGITRFLAIYPSSVEVSKIGPVRSARPYYLDWLGEFGNAVFMHVGGSPEALGLISERSVFDINEMSRGWYFWRSNDRYMPHNTYTSNELWNKALSDFGEKKPATEYGVWKYSEVIPTGTSTNFIDIDFAPPTYSVVWRYNTSTEEYARYQAGDGHVEESGRVILTNNIMVIETDVSVIDEVGRRKIRTIGTGDCQVARDGVLLRGKWAKENVSARLRCLDESGVEIALRPGRTWVEIVGKNNQVNFR